MKIRDTNHVADFRDLCPRLFPPASFVESRRNGIWAYRDGLPADRDDSHPSKY